MNLELFKQQYERSKNFVDVTMAFNYLRIFSENFDKQTVAVQAKILNDDIRRIIVMDDGVTVEVFGAKGTDTVVAPSGVARCRTGVLPVFNLVDPSGIEPLTARAHQNTPVEYFDETRP